MSGFGDYLEKAILNTTLRGSAFIAPATSTYVALFTSDPLDDGSGTELDSGTALGYARVVMATTDWTAPAASSPTSGSQCANVYDVVFPTAGNTWPGPISHFAIFDAPTGGNMLYHGILGTPETVAAGNTPRYEAGTLIVNVH